MTMLVVVCIQGVARYTATLATSGNSSLKVVTTMRNTTDQYSFVWILKHPPTPLLQTGNQLNELPDDEEVDNVVDFTTGDVLGKTLALVNQVSFFFFHLFSLAYIYKQIHASQIKQYFALCCKSESVPVLKLIKWV